MSAKKKTIEELDGSDATPAIAIASLTLPPPRPEGRKLEGDAAGQAKALLNALKDEAKIF